MSKRMALLEIDGDFDFEGILGSARKTIMGGRKGSVYMEGGRPEGSYTTPGAQIIMKFKSRYIDSDVRILISHGGKIQVFYETIGDFCHCFWLLRRLLGPELFENLNLIDADIFEVCLATFEMKYIRFNNNRMADYVDGAPDEQTLQNNMRLALMNALLILLKEMENVAEEGDIYDFTFSFMSTVQRAFRDAMLELWEDKELAKQIIQSIIRHLQVLLE